MKIAEALGRSSEQAFALALLAHATVLVLTSVAGAGAFLRLGWTSSVHEVEDVVSGAPDPETPRGHRSDWLCPAGQGRVRGAKVHPVATKRRFQAGAGAFGQRGSSGDRIHPGASVARHEP